ncbi:suppressor of SWI4 1 homolog [Haliotis rufescens]|uniref:suppressor of SWI4 1 homolog n=1 Tax=Haliotis rufescens TaxID=6454 RepID=UPI00201EC685|nr:suppressor of SWI4 1 homolog [Haliotis rufescens]
MGRKRKHGSSRKTQAIHEETQDAVFKTAPHSFVFHRGKVGVTVRTLIQNLRQVMEPYTARKLQVRKNNVLKDFVNVAGLLNISHFLILSKTDKYIQLRIGRVPRGPTLTFQVREFCLSKDVLSAQKKPDLSGKVFDHHPLLVMNGFTGNEKSIQLITTMFQNMFPSINVNKVNLNHIKRCVLVSYDPETKLIDFRHYTISLAPVGLTKGVKKLTKTQLPDLSKYNDISEFIERGGNLSESEGEQDGPHNEVTLPQQIHGRGNLKAGQSAIRLKEIGPRMTLELVKIEEGLCEGAVIHHSFIHKTPTDLLADKKKKELKLKLKQSRQTKQMQNVKKKEKLKAEHKQRSLEGMKRKHDSEQTKESDDESDDDIAHYRREVGANPDKDLFPSMGKKRKRVDGSDVPTKKVRKNPGKEDSKLKQKKQAPPGFSKKQQVAKQKKKKEMQKKMGTKKESQTGRKKNMMPRKTGSGGKTSMGAAGKKKGMPKKMGPKGSKGKAGFKPKRKTGR